MRAVLCKQFGPPEDLVIDEVADPTPGPGEVLMKLRLRQLRFDTLMLEDKYQFKADLPYIPGRSGGHCYRHRRDVTGIEVGERVVSGLGAVGGYAEFAVAKENAVRKLPDGVGFAESTGLLYAHGTTYYGLKERADLQPGESLLVLGAGGHVGLSAVEIGKLMGARFIAAASSEEKLDLCRKRGADETINYSEESLKDRAKELTNGEGVNVIYDVVGGDYAEQALRAIAWEGRFLVIGFTAGIPAIPLNLTLLKSCQIVGVFYGAMTSRDPKLANEIAEDLLGWVANGDLKPHISATYGLDGAAGALRNLMDRKSVGKIVIEP